MIELFNEDCSNTLDRMQDGSVDLFMQDTPFGVTQNQWDVVPDLEKMWPKWLRVGKENCAFLFFATQPFACDLISSNRKMFKYDLIWYKPLCSGFLNAKKMPLRNHESILVFYKSPPTYNPQMGVGLRKTGKRKHDRTGTNYGNFATQIVADRYDDKGTRYPQSVIEFTNGDRTNEKDHPTQKPLSLIRYLVKTYSNKGDLVFDGYTGSGTTAEACIREERRFVGSELDTGYFSIAKNRIGKAKKVIELF